MVQGGQNVNGLEWNGMEWNGGDGMDNRSEGPEWIEQPGWMDHRWTILKTDRAEEAPTTGTVFFEFKISIACLS